MVLKQNICRITKTHQLLININNYCAHVLPASCSALYDFTEGNSVHIPTNNNNVNAKGYLFYNLTDGNSYILMLNKYNIISERFRLYDLKRETVIQTRSLLPNNF
jgi:hypothetical protein